MAFLKGQAMLIRFYVENWKSFPELEFSAIAGKEQRHGERVAIIKKPNMRLLPVSAIYGGNASGKSNLVEAVTFAQRFIVKGAAPSQAIAVKPFALNEDAQKRPVKFVFEILASDERAYRYSFTVSRAEVLEESLTELLTTVDRVLFERRGDEIVLHNRLKGNVPLEYVGRGTRKNLLFLTNIAHQKRDELRAVYDWFHKTLLTLTPNASCDAFNMYANEQCPFQPQNQETLEEFDVGIERIETIETPPAQLPFQINVKIQGECDKLPDGALFQIGPYLVSNRDGNPHVEKMVAVHSLENKPGEKIRFDLEDESDGTRRLLDLIPAFTFLRDSKQSRVIFIDEIDRSLHHLLTKKLIEDYLSDCSPDARTQLFFTTHDALLMDQDIFRRDELWLVEKTGDRSTIASLNEYRIRHDKSLVNAYLYGRFGGVPNFRMH